jgi:signal transduction histidine kinase
MLMPIKRLWHDVTHGGAKIDSSNFSRRELAYFINVYSVLAFLSLGVFGALHITVEQNLHLGSLELVCASVIALNMLAFRVLKNVGIVRFGLLATILTALLILLVTGGTQGTGIFWFFVFPVAAFFLAGRRGGMVWMGALYASVTLLLILEQLRWIEIPYSLVVVRQLFVSLLVVTVGVAVYQRSRDKYEAEEQVVDRAKSQFVTLASHQLRTPIAAVSWFSEMLLNDDAGKLNAEQRDYVQQLYASNRRLAGMVDVMLLVSSLELSELSVRPEQVKLADLSRKALRDQLQKHPGKKLTITEEYEALPKMPLDTHITGVILQNIFSNAVKYTPEGGTITVRIARSDEKLSAGSKGSVGISIQDTGYGIPASQHAKVFDKLFRADNIRVKDTDGTGLGLYSVRALLEQVGGRIWFESEEDQGSTFFVLLPIEGMKKYMPNQKGNHV